MKSIYKISLIADGHELLIENIIADNIDNAKEVYQGLHKVDFNCCAYQCAWIRDVSEANDETND